MTRTTIWGGLGLCVLATMAGCDDSIPPPLDDSGAGDVAVVEAGTDAETDGPVADQGRDGPVPDVTPADGPPPDFPPGGPFSATGLYFGGGTISTGGEFTLRSLVGHPMSVSTISGGGYVLTLEPMVVPQN